MLIAGDKGGTFGWWVEAARREVALWSNSLHCIRLPEASTAVKVVAVVRRCGNC